MALSKYMYISDTFKSFDLQIKGVYLYTAILTSFVGIVYFHLSIVRTHYILPLFMYISLGEMKGLSQTMLRCSLQTGLRYNLIGTSAVCSFGRFKSPGQKWSVN